MCSKMLYLTITIAFSLFRVVLFNPSLTTTFGIYFSAISLESIIILVLLFKPISSHLETRNSHDVVSRKSLAILAVNDSTSTTYRSIPLSSSTAFPIFKSICFLIDLFIDIHIWTAIVFISFDIMSYFPRATFLSAVPSFPSASGLL